MKSLIIVIGLVMFLCSGSIFADSNSKTIGEIERQSRLITLEIAKKDKDNIVLSIVSRSDECKISNDSLKRLRVDLTFYLRENEEDLGICKYISMNRKLGNILQSNNMTLPDVLTIKNNGSRADIHLNVKDIIQGVFRSATFSSENHKLLVEYLHKGNQSLTLEVKIDLKTSSSNAAYTIISPYITLDSKDYDFSFLRNVKEGMD